MPTLADNKVAGTFIITKDNMKRLDEEKERTGVSKSALVNLALCEYLDKKKASE